jgi:hypothetical protein
VATNGGESTDGGRKKSESRDLASYMVLIAALLFVGGCTHVERGRARSEGKLERNEAALREESQALTTAVGNVLSAFSSPKGAQTEASKKPPSPSYPWEAKDCPIQQKPLTGIGIVHALTTQGCIMTRFRTCSDCNSEWFQK